MAVCEGCEVLAETCFLAVESESVKTVFAEGTSIYGGRLAEKCSYLPSA